MEQHQKNVLESVLRKGVDEADETDRITATVNVANEEESIADADATLESDLSEDAKCEEATDDTWHLELSDDDASDLSNGDNNSCKS